MNPSESGSLMRIVGKLAKSKISGLLLNKNSLPHPTQKGFCFYLNAYVPQSAKQN